METSVRRLAGVIVVSLVLGGAAGAVAGPLDTPGATKALTCAACHGAGGQSPSNTMPVLSGMWPVYFKKAIADYAAGKRPSTEMEPYAKMVVQMGVDDVAAYFSAQPRAATAVSADAAAVERGRPEEAERFQDRAPVRIVLGGHAPSMPQVSSGTARGIGHFAWLQ